LVWGEKKVEERPYSSDWDEREAIEIAATTSGEEEWGKREFDRRGDCRTERVRLPGVGKLKGARERY